MKKILYSFVCILSALFLFLVPVYCAQNVIEFFATEDFYNEHSVDTCEASFFNVKSLSTIQVTLQKYSTTEDGYVCYYVGQSYNIPSGYYNITLIIDGLSEVVANNIYINGGTLQYYSDEVFSDESTESTESTGSTESTESTESTGSTESSVDSGVDFPSGTNISIFNKIHEDLLIIIVLLGVYLGTKSVSIIVKNIGGEK